MRSGLEVYPIEGVDMPLWIKVQDKHATVCKRKITEGDAAKYFFLKGAEVQFAPGLVMIKMPSSRVFRTAFNIMAILDIRQSGGRTIVWRNRYCCKKCHMMTGTQNGPDAPGRTHGHMDRPMKCTRCGHEWLLENI